MLTDFRWTLEREHAQDAIRAHTRQIERVRRDHSLTNAAKTARIAAIDVATRDRLTHLRQVEADRVSTHLRALLANPSRTPDADRLVAHLQSYSDPDEQSRAAAAYYLATPAELSA